MMNNEMVMNNESSTIREIKRFLVSASGLFENGKFSYKKTTLEENRNELEKGYVNCIAPQFSEVFKTLTLNEEFEGERNFASNFEVSDRMVVMMPPRTAPGTIPSVEEITEGVQTSIIEKISDDIDDINDIKRIMFTNSTIISTMQESCIVNRIDLDSKNMNSLKDIIKDGMEVLNKVTFENTVREINTIFNTDFEKSTDFSPLDIQKGDLVISLKMNERTDVGTILTSEQIEEIGYTITAMYLS